MTKTPAEVVAYARARAGKRFEVGQCLRFCRTGAGAPGGTYDARAAWDAAEHRHTTGVPPAGSFIFFRGGSAGHGHVAISLGGGLMVSTDAPLAGRIGIVSLDWMRTHWPSEKYIGWTEDISGVWVRQPVPVKSRVNDPHAVSLQSVQPGDKGDDVKDLQRALIRKGFRLVVDGVFGVTTQRAYADWQRRLGYSGDDADGHPGRRSLESLGLRVVD